MKLIVNILMDDDIFSFNPGHSNNNNKFTDLFYTGTMKIVSSISTNKYLLIAHGN